MIQWIILPMQGCRQMCSGISIKIVVTRPSLLLHQSRSCFLGASRVRKTRPSVLDAASIKSRFLSRSMGTTSLPARRALLFIDASISSKSIKISRLRIWLLHHVVLPLPCAPQTSTTSTDTRRSSSGMLLPDTGSLPCSKGVQDQWANRHHPITSSNCEFPIAPFR
jgi:hypothetical protein